MDIQRADAVATQRDKNNKQITFKNSITDSITEISKIDLDNAKDLNVVMPMYNLIEYSDNCSGTSRNLWQDYKDEPQNPITDSNSFKFKAELLANTNNCDIINAEIAVPLKFLSNFGRTHECL